MVYGVGIDIVDVERFKRALAKWGDRLSQRLFTASELSYCLSKRFPERHLAARFAGKVSLFKALGQRLSFKGVEITRDGNGRPLIKASGLDGRFRFNLSITHDRNFSIAEILVERD